MSLWQLKSHSSSLKIASFDRANASSYYCSIETVSLSCTVSELQQDLKSPLLTHPTSIWRHLGGDPVEISPRSLAVENYSLWYSAGLWRTDAQTDTRRNRFHRSTPAQRRAVKTVSKFTEQLPVCQRQLNNIFKLCIFNNVRNSFRPRQLVRRNVHKVAPLKPTLTLSLVGIYVYMQPTVYTLFAYCQYEEVI